MKNAHKRRTLGKLNRVSTVTLLLCGILALSALKNADAETVSHDRLRSRVVTLDGVDYSCLGAIQSSVIKKLTATDPESGAELRSLIRSKPAYLCKAKRAPHAETASWCDGSACYGAEARLLQSGICQVTGHWTGQDDQDSIDWEDFQENCVTQESR
jgi:hypothetical protein